MVRTRIADNTDRKACVAAHLNLSVTEVHYKRALYDDECLVCFRVAVSNEVAFEFNDIPVITKK
jgi:hypothetical protein